MTIGGAVVIGDLIVRHARFGIDAPIKMRAVYRGTIFSEDVDEIRVWAEAEKARGCELRPVEIQEWRQASAQFDGQGDCWDSMADMIRTRAQAMIRDSDLR